MEALAGAVADLPILSVGEDFNAKVLEALAPEPAPRPNWAVWGGSALVGSVAGWAAVIVLSLVFLVDVETAGRFLELARDPQGLLAALQLGLIKEGMALRDLISTSYKLLRILALGLDSGGLAAPISAAAVLAAGILTTIISPWTRTNHATH